MLPILVVHFLVQEILFILGPILSDISQNIIQGQMTSSDVITYVLLLVQCFQILEYVVGSFGRANQKCPGDVIFIFEMTTHGYTGIRLSTTSRTTEKEKAGNFGSVGTVLILYLDLTFFNLNFTCFLG